MKKSKIIGLIIIVSLLLCSCGRYREYNLRPDDDLSRAVRDAVSEDFYYLGKEERDSGEIWYEYQIKKTEPNTIVEFINAINGSLNGEQKKIEILVYVEIGGGLDQVFRLKNYSDSKCKTADYDGLGYLYICSPRVTTDPFFFAPSTYTSIKGIKKLEINQQMQKRADEEGIDWYACWSDLEEVIVREDD